MIHYTRTQAERLLKIDFIRFCIVGGSGFLINLVILVVLHRIIGITVFIAQMIGAEIALFSNFMMHHHWTYKHHKVEKSLPVLIVQFHATSWPAILGSAVMVTAFQKILHLNNLSSLLISSAIALFWNLLWSKFVVWRDVSSAEDLV